MAIQLVTTQHIIGVVLVFSGLFPIYTQLALQVGWIVKKEEPELGAVPGAEGMHDVPESAIKLLDKLLDNAGWMVSTLGAIPDPGKCEKAIFNQMA